MSEEVSNPQNMSEIASQEVARLNTEAWSVVMRDPLRARDLATQALELALAGGSAIDEVHSRLNLAWSRIFLSDYRRAQNDLDLVISYVDEPKPGERIDPALGCKILNAYGAALQGQSDFSGALERFQESYTLAEQHDLKDRQVAALNNIGEIELDLRHLVPAREYLTRAMELLGDDLDTELVIRSNLGDIALRGGEDEQAEQNYRRALELATLRDDRVNLGELYARLGALETSRGNTADAESHYIESMRIAHAIQSPALRCSILLRLGDLHGQNDDSDMALEFYRQGLEIANEIDSRYFQYRLYKRIGDIHEQAGRPSEALLSFKRYMDLKTEIVSESAQYRYEQTNRRLEGERLRREYQRLEAVSTIAQEITSKLELEQIFRGMYDRINTILDAEILGIALYDDVAQTLSYRLVLEKGDIVESQQYDATSRDSVAAWVVRNREEVVIDDLHAQYATYIDHLPDDIGDLNYSGMYLPLEIKERMIGVLSVQAPRPRAYSDIDVRTMRTLAGFIAIAIDNALIVDRVTVINRTVQQENDELQRAYEEISKVANRDELTGLANRRMFREMLDVQLESAEGRSAKVGVVFIDLNEFKPVNDRYGHAVGDALLKEVGRRLSSGVRSRDIVARLGGDEFAMILPDISGRKAVERIARKVGRSLASEFRIASSDESNSLHVHVSASTGVAVYPDNGTSSDALLEWADSEMYGEKRAR